MRARGQRERKRKRSANFACHKFLQRVAIAVLPLCCHEGLKKSVVEFVERRKWQPMEIFARASQRIMEFVTIAKGVEDIVSDRNGHVSASRYRRIVCRSGNAVKSKESCRANCRKLCTSSGMQRVEGDWSRQRN